jgi:cell division protein FtsL
MRQSTLLFTALALIVGFALFKVKYEVVEVEQKLTQTCRQIKREKENIHILKAEWSHLNEPQRLQALAEKYLDIKPMKTEQVAAIMSDFDDAGSIGNDQAQPHLASLKEGE